MKAPTKETAIATVAGALVSALLALPILAAIWTGAATFGIELPRPVWQDDLRRLACRMARIEADYYGRKLERERTRLVDLEDAADRIDAADREAWWRSRIERTASKDDIEDLETIVEPAKAAWKECQP